MNHVTRWLVSACLATIFACTLGGAQALAADKKDDKAGATAAAGKAPKIQFAEQSHSFGEVMQNSALKNTFTFKNIGDDVLKIEHVKAG